MTPKDIDHIHAVLARISVIDEKLDHIAVEQAAIKTQTTVTNGRVTALERWQARLVGIVVGVFAVGGVVDLGHRLGMFN